MIDLEQIICDRLAAYMPPGVRVLTAPDIIWMTEGAQLAPGVYLLYDGYDVVEVAPGGDPTRVVVTWITWVSVRNVRAITSGAPAREEATPIIDAIYLALAGWKPPGASKPMQLYEAPAPVYTAGHLHIPLGWRLEQVLANPSIT